MRSRTIGKGSLLTINPPLSLHLFPDHPVKTQCSSLTESKDGRLTTLKCGYEKDIFGEQASLVSCPPSKSYEIFNPEGGLLVELRIQKPQNSKTRRYKETVVFHLFLLRYFCSSIKQGHIESICFCFLPIFPHKWLEELKTSAPTLQSGRQRLRNKAISVHCGAYTTQIS